MSPDELKQAPWSLSPRKPHTAPLLVRLHELISQNLGRELVLTQGRRMRPRFQSIFAMNRRGKALAPAVSREMSGHILDGGRVDEIGVRTGVICDANPKSVKGMGYSIVQLHPSTP